MQNFIEVKFCFTFSEIDPCYSDPCKNGGKCLSKGQDYKCQCKDGFEGKFCEKKGGWNKSTYKSESLRLNHSTAQG